MAKLSARQFKQLVEEDKPEQAMTMLLGRLDGVSPDERRAVVTRIGQVLSQVFDDFAFNQINRFMAYSRQRLDQEATGVFEESLAVCHQLTRQWHQKLLSLEPERHARSLREAVRARDTDAAMIRLEGLLVGHAGESNFEQRLRYVGVVLGSMPNDQQAAQKLLDRAARDADRLGCTADQIDTAVKAWKDRLNLLGREGSINRESEFNSSLTRLIMEARELLPSSQVVSETPAEDIARLTSNIRAMIRTTFLPKKPISWSDICDLFVEFVPTEVSEAGKRGGVEGRLSQQLTPVQLRAIERVFNDTGDIKTVRDAMIAHASGSLAPRDMARAAEVMGLMGHTDFADFLQDRVSDRRYSNVRDTMISAMGHLSGPDSSEALLKEISKHIKGAKREGPDRRRVVNAIASLGGITRSPRVDLKTRRAAIAEAIELAPEDDTRLALEFAVNLMPGSPQTALSPSQRTWFIDALTRGLWLGEETPEFAGGDDAQRTVLGWRQPIVEALEQFDDEGVIEMIIAAEPLAMRYSGAYLALAEIAADVGGEAMLPLLNTCLLSAAQHEDSAASRYSRETFYDSTDGERKPITSRMVMAALIYGVNSIGGLKAEEILLEIYHRIRDKEIPQPGDEATKILYNVHLKVEGDNGTVRPEGAPTFDKPGDEAVDGPALGMIDIVPPEDIGECIKTLGKRFIFQKTKKRAAKIPAIQAIASARAIEGVDALLDLLTDDDPYIEAAVINALKEFGGPKAPVASMKALLAHCVMRLEKIRPAARNQIVDVLTRMNPSRPAMKEALMMELSRAAPGSKTHHAIRRVIEQSEAMGGMASLVGSHDSEIEYHDLGGAEDIQSYSPETAGGGASRPSGGINALEAKRQYFEERRAWIAGGKKGQEPKRPAGA